MAQTVVHPIPPVFDRNSELLILGSFPSVRSRERQFFYGHPQNRFWNVLAAVFGCPVPETTEEKKALLMEHRIALWDVIARCEIDGSADGSIRSVIPNDIRPLLRAAPIRRIAVNGTTADKYYRKYLFAQTDIKAILLPSTSPANAAWSLSALIDAWAPILIA